VVLELDHGREQPGVELGSGAGELEPTHAPVVRVEQPADEAGGLEPVDVMRDRRALEVDVRTPLASPSR